MPRSVRLTDGLLDCVMQMPASSSPEETRMEVIARFSGYQTGTSRHVYSSIPPFDAPVTTDWARLALILATTGFPYS